MSRDRFDVLERFAPLFETPEPSFERFLLRRDHKRRNQRIAAGVVGMALFVAPVALLAGLLSSDRVQAPSAPGPGVPEAPKVDYVIDLNSGETSPLPKAIIREIGGSVLTGPYAASPDGSQIAYARRTEDGNRQIFIAGRAAGRAPGIAGTEPRQVTRDPRGATSPAWSPDGTKIAYEGYGSGETRNLFVLDVATGGSTLVTRDSSVCLSCSLEPQFTPDGSALIYTSGTEEYPVVRTVPVAGGKSTLLIGPGEGVTDAGNASLSPDGSFVTFLGSGEPESSKPGFHCGPCRFVANADGTDRRVIPGWVSNPAGTWSPDGSRIVCLALSGNRIIVVDITTGEATPVAEGRSAIWLDDHTLLVEV